MTKPHPFQTFHFRSDRPNLRITWRHEFFGGIFWVLQLEQRRQSIARKEVRDRPYYTLRGVCVCDSQDNRGKGKHLHMQTY